MKYINVRKISKWFLVLIFIFYVVLCFFLYFNQTKLLFHPHKTTLNKAYNYHPNYEEIFIPFGQDIKIHNVLFNATRESKGLVFFLHGNAGSIYSWGKIANIYNQLGYDVWMMDYRSFGKSNGEIFDENQLLSDVDKVFEEVKQRFPIEKINVIGYSMGTGLATWVASKNAVERLILMAPYYGLDYLVSDKLPIIPSFLLKYPIRTFEFIKNVNCPIYIFHGRQDGLIPFEHGLMLKKLLKKNDVFFGLTNQGHGGIHHHPMFLKEIRYILP